METMFHFLRRWGLQHNCNMRNALSLIVNMELMHTLESSYVAFVDIWARICCEHEKVTNYHPCSSATPTMSKLAPLLKESFHKQYKDPQVLLSLYIRLMSCLHHCGQWMMLGNDNKELVSLQWVQRHHWQDFFPNFLTKNHYWNDWMSVIGNNE